MVIQILRFLNAYSSAFFVLIALLSLSTIFVEIRRLSNERRDEARRLNHELREQRLQDEQQERERDTLATERRRLTEVNVDVGHEVQLTQDSLQSALEKPFVIFRLPLKNVGDGPVDILGALVSSRILSSKYRQGIGLRSRDVEWSDYEHYFWNQRDPAALFAGISTTKNMVASADHFVRLAQGESATLRRIDSVNNPQLLKTRIPLYMMYRVFLVARGYPLGEIMRQLGGGPPDPLQNVDQGQLRFRTLAQPNFEQWRRIQEAITNINRLVFRLATNEPDPLGRLTDTDAWRFFVLQHDEFIKKIAVRVGDLGDLRLPDRLAQAPAAGNVELTFNEFADMIWQRYYPDHNLPLDFGSDVNFQTAQRVCRQVLAPVVTSWHDLLTVIQQCKDYPEKAGGYAESDLKQPVAAAETRPYANDGYAARVHRDNHFRQKWLDLMETGYFISRPFPHAESSSDNVTAKPPTSQFTYRDIPHDPRVLEPYVMRLHYFLETVKLDTATGTGTPAGQ